MAFDKLNEVLSFLILLSGLFFKLDTTYSQINIDSLVGITKSVEDDTAKVVALNRLSWEFQFSFPDSALALSKRALTLSYLLEYQKGKGLAYKVLGSINDNLGQYDTALAYYDSAYLIFVQLAKGAESNEINNLRGIVEVNKGNYPKALDYFLNCLSGVQDKKALAKTYLNLGVTYGLMGDIDKELDYYRRSAQMNRETKSFGQLRTDLNNIGTTYLVAEQYDSARYYFTEASKTGHLEDDKYLDAVLMSNMGSVFRGIGQPDTAIELIENALRIQEKLDDKKNTIHSFLALSRAYSDKGEGDKAYKALEKSYELALDIGDKLGVKKTTEILHKLAFEKGDLEKAYHYMKVFKAFSDSIKNEDRAREIGRLETTYEYEQRQGQKDIKQQFRDQTMEAKHKQQQWIVYFLILGFIIVAALAFLLFVNYRNKRKDNILLEEQKKQLRLAYEEINSINENLETMVLERTNKLQKANQKLSVMNKELDTFLYRSSHDFKAPISTLSGLSIVAMSTVKDEYAVDLFSKVHDTAKNMDKMLNKLFMITLINKHHGVRERVNIGNVLNQVENELKREIEAKGVKIVREISKEYAVIYSNWTHLHIILFNLMENAVVFCLEGDGLVNIILNKTDAGLILQVEDNGEGINELYMDRLFELFYRGSDKSRGNGLGLYMARKAVEGLGGEISAKNKPDRGTVFTITIPMKV